MKASTLIILLAFVVSCNTQDSEFIEVDNYSSYNANEIEKTVELGGTASKYESVIQETLQFIGLSNSDIEIRTTPKFGAFSVIQRNCRRRFFLYNEAFFDSVLTVTKNMKSVQSICFHEIAHHFYRHPLKSKWEAHRHELEADAYSGYLMRLKGATIEESIAAMEHFGNDSPSNTHPKKSTRINHIKAGYIDASIRVFGDTIVQEVEKNLFLEALKNTQSEVQKTNENFANLPLNLPIESPFKQPTYNFLNSLITITDKGQVLDYASESIVGEVITPFPNSPYKLLKFETSTYKIENEAIYSIALGAPIKLGTKIN